MIETAVQQEVLFFDDFMHQTVDRVQWDHIKFNHPVFLEQIRIIPKDCFISLKNGTNRFGRTFPKSFRLEFYANNLNKKEEERANLVKIGSLLYNDDDQHNTTSDFTNFTITPQSIPLDWLVIVGSYLTLSVALIGVKAKQSMAPTNLNTPINNMKLINQPPFMPHQVSANFLSMTQSKPNMNATSQSISMMQSNMESTNGTFAIRATNPALIPQPQTNMLSHPPPNHNMPSLLPTPLLTIPPSNMNHHHQQVPSQQQNDFHHQGFINQANFQPNSNMRPTNEQIRFQINQPPPPNPNAYSISLIQSSGPTNQNIRSLLPPPPQQQQLPSQTQRNQKIPNIQPQQSPQHQQQSISGQQQKSFSQRTNQYHYRMPIPNNNANNTQLIQQTQMNTTNLISNRISPSKVTKSTDSGPLLSQPSSESTISAEFSTTQQINHEKTTSSQLIANNNNASPNGSNLSQDTQSAPNDKITPIDETISNENELNMIETNLAFYLEQNDEVDELDLVKQNRTGDYKSKLTISEFLLDQIRQIDVESLNLVEIKNPILTRYEQALRENSKFEMTSNEKKTFEYYTTQNEAFRSLFLKRDELDLTSEKSLALIENLTFNLSKSTSLFYNLFGTNSESLKRLNELVVQIVNKNFYKPNDSFIKREWLSRVKSAKLGLKLAGLLVTKYDLATARSLIDLGLQANLVDLIELGVSSANASHLMSVSMVLKCLNVLNWSIQFKYGMEQFVYMKSRLMTVFYELKDTTNKSRLILVITQILTSLKFYELISQLEAKCQDKFIKKLTTCNQFDLEITNIVENIYIYCIRSLKLNKKQLSSESQASFNRGTTSVTTSIVEQTNGESDTLIKSSNNKKLKPNDYTNELYLVDSGDYPFDEIENDSNKIPLQNLFDKFPSEMTTYSAHNILLRWFDSFGTLKYILMIKSYIYDRFKQSKSKQLTFLNDVIDKLVNDIYSINDTNDNNCVGIEYLLNNLKLTKCVFKVVLGNEDSQGVKFLDLASKALALCSSLAFNLNRILNRTCDTDTDTYLLDSVDKFQLLALLVNHTNLTKVFAAPDGNMSNKYVYCLLNWFELMLVDKHFNELNANKDFNSYRCYILNSLSEIFYNLCKLNPYWNMPRLCDDSTALILVLEGEFSSDDYRMCLKRLNQYTSLLINSFSSLRLKAFQESLSQASIDQLIYKLKIIKSCIEPICITMSSLANENKTYDNKLALSIANLSSYYNKIQCLNQFVDLFRRTIDRNLSMFFLKQYFNSCLPSNEHATCKKRILIDYLNSNITILNILNNLTHYKSIEINLFDLFNANVSPNEFNTKLHLAHLNLARYALDLNEQFNAKRFLGHLISRNFLHVCTHLLNKSTDYLIFYSRTSQLSTFTTLNLNQEQLNLFMRLIDPTVRLIRTLLSKLIKIRNENFSDCSALPVLFRFYGVFNYCLQSSFNKLASPDPCLLELHKSINTNLNDVFMSFTQPILTIDDKTAIKSSLFTSLFRELAKYTVDKPFNFYYGLQLFSEFLPLPLPIPIASQDENREEDIIMLNERRLLSDHLEPLFIDEKYKQIDLFELNEKCPSSLKTMFRLLSISSSDSKVNDLFKRVTVQMTDLSEKMCSTLLKCLLDYAIELLAVIRNEKELDSNEDDCKGGDLEAPSETNEESQSNAENKLDLIKIENDRIDGLINEIDSQYQVNNLNGIKLKDIEMDSFLYETDIMLEDSSFFRTSPGESVQNKEIKETLDKPVSEPSLVSTNTMSTTMPTQEQLQIEETNEQLNELKEKYKISLLKNFSNLVKFICGLLELDRPGCKVNPIRIEFMHLISNQKTSLGKKSKTKQNYLKFICSCIKFCNQLDLISKQPEAQQEDLIKAKELIQECLFKLIETLVRYTPDLLVKHFKLEMFYYEDTSSTNETNEQDEQILDLALKCLLDHLSTTKLESIKISSSALTSLILLSKQFKIFLMSHDSLKNEMILLNPILKSFLVDNTLSWSNFIRELDKSFRSDSIEYVNLLAKFFIHVNLLLENLIVDKRFYSNTSKRLRDLFEWHNSKFNIKGLQIDTIPISKSLKNRPSNENSLDNLLILIANVERSTNLDLDEKIEFCSNQTKRIVNILNDVTISRQDIKLESKLQLDLVADLGTSMSACEFSDYFMKRAIFSSKFSQNDLKKYETEWLYYENHNTSKDSEKPSDDLVELDLDANLKYLFKSDLEFSSALVLDQNLNKQLNQNLEQNYLEEVFCESLDSIVESKLDKQENAIDADSMLSSASSTTKSKSVDIIRFFNESYRRYKAPMRGGHNNSVSRHLAAPTLVNTSVNSNLIAPPNPNLVNNLNNLLAPSAMILNTASQVARHDSFRTRAPNTSRPASLHVDEYYRLQNANKQQNHVK